MAMNASAFDPLGVDGIRALCRLLNPDEEEEHEEEHNLYVQSDRRNPGNICKGTAKSRQPAKPYVKVEAKVKPQNERKQEQKKKAEEKVEEIPDPRPPPEYEVDDDFLLVETCDKRLKLALPYPVDPALSTAKWDAAYFTLSVTVALKREIEYVQM